MKNLYNEKEAKILNLQGIMSGLIDKRTNLYLEYFDVDDKLIYTFLENHLSGLRSDLARYTKNLNNEKKKGDNLIKTIEVNLFLFKKNLNNEIVEINLFKVSKNNESSNDITFKTAEIKSTKNSTSNEKFPTTNNTINNTERFQKLIKKKSSKREGKIKILHSLQEEINKNIQQIENLSNEIEQYDNENEELQQTINNLSSLLSHQMSLIYPYEIYLHKLMKRRGLKAAA